LRTALVETGLYEDEAQAMVDTGVSYFARPPAAALHPAARVDRCALPIAIEPVPDELVRTMVGREILTSNEELALADWLAESAATTTTPEPAVLDDLGRFAEPRLRRALELLEDPEAQSYTQALIDLANQMP
jgi:hypothetical protein